MQCAAKQICFWRCGDDLKKLVTKISSAYLDHAPGLLYEVWRACAKDVAFIVCHIEARDVITKEGEKMKCVHFRPDVDNIEMKVDADDVTWIRAKY